MEVRFMKKTMGMFLMVLLSFSSACAGFADVLPDLAVEKSNDEVILREALAVRQQETEIRAIVSKLETPRFKEISTELWKYDDAPVIDVLLKVVGNKANNPLLRSQAAWALGELFYCSDPAVSMPELVEATKDKNELVSRGALNAVEDITQFRPISSVWSIFYYEQANESKKRAEQRVEEVYNRIKEKLIRFLENNEPFDYHVHLTLLPEDKKAELLHAIEIYYLQEEQALEQLRQKAEELKQQ